MTKLAHPYGSASPRTLEDLTRPLSLSEVRQALADREPDLGTIPLKMWQMVSEQCSMYYRLTGRVITTGEGLRDLCEARARMEER